MLTLVHESDAHTHAAPDAVGGDGAPVDLDELCRLAAQQMLAVALEAERRAYLDAHADQRADDGRRLVVGNGHHQPREITTAAGRVEVTAPRVDDRRDGHAFTSAILPPYMRRSPKVTEVLPVPYLRACQRMTSSRRWRGSSGQRAVARRHRRAGSAVCW